MTCDALRHSAPPPLSYSTCLLPVQPARERPLAWVRAVTDEECVRNGNASWSDARRPRSPQMLSYADFWFSWSGGWWHRWTDQQFWPHALYVTNATGGVISLEHHRRHRAFVHVGG